MYEKVLAQSFLTKEQAVVYSALLKAGAIPAGKLSQKTPLKRALVYKVLEQLVEIGLVKKQEKRGQIAVFTPTHPSKLKDLAQIREKNTIDAQRILDSIIPGMISDFNLISGKPNVRFFEGIDGLKKVYEDTLTKNNKIYALLSPAAATPELKKWLNSIYVKKRLKLNISAKVILSDSKEGKAYTKLNKKSLRETIVVPHKQCPIDIEINIYGKNSVSFISYRKEELIGVILESPAIYSTMKTFFNLAWAQAQKIAKQ